MLHLGTIEYGLREFIVLLDITTHKCYIEEVVLVNQSWTEDVTANCKFIDDDNLAFDLAKFVEENKLTDLSERANELNDLKKLSLLFNR